MKKSFFFFVFVSLSSILNAQTGIGTKSPDASAALEIKNENKGILIPRLALTGTNDSVTIATPANSLMIYNTATVSDVTPGYYYWNGNAWNRLLTIDDTAPSNSWLENVTEKPATSNTKDIYQMGNVGIGIKAPKKGIKLEVLGAVRMGGNHLGNAGTESMAFGYGNEASGNYSHSVGYGNVTSGITSGVSSGYLNKASATNANIGGGRYNNATNIETTIGGGKSNNALGSGSTVSGGIENSAYSYGEWTGGLYGKGYTADGIGNWVDTDRIFSIGNGRYENYRSNALTILKNGNAGFGNTATVPTERIDVGDGAVRIRDINSLTGDKTDKFVVADPTGILKTTNLDFLSGWNLIGNSGTVAGKNFIGTTDNADVVFKRWDTPAGLLSSIDTYNTSFGVNSYKGTPRGTYAGRWNTAIGYNSLHGDESGNVMGHDNVAVGSNSLSKNQGGRNTAIGSEALKNNIKGQNNSTIGFQSLIRNDSGNYNTAIGNLALSMNSSGSSNTAIGYSSGPNSSNLLNTTAIGNGATVTLSNTIQLGNDAITAISGQVPFTTTSDRRYKEDIKSIPLGLDFVNKLHPVEYIRTNNESKTKEWGVIAQELQQILEEANYKNAGIVQEDGSAKKMLSVRYTDLIAPMIKGMQELTIQNKKFEEKNNQQKERIDQLQLELNEIKSWMKQIKESDK